LVGVPLIPADEGELLRGLVGATLGAVDGGLATLPDGPAIPPEGTGTLAGEVVVAGGCAEVIGAITVDVAITVEVATTDEVVEGATTGAPIVGDPEAWDTSVAEGALDDIEGLSDEDCVEVEVVVEVSVGVIVDTTSDVGVNTSLGARVDKEGTTELEGGREGEIADGGYKQSTDRQLTV